MCVLLLGKCLSTCAPLSASTAEPSSAARIRALGRRGGIRASNSAAGAHELEGRVVVRGREGRRAQQQTPLLVGVGHWGLMKRRGGQAVGVRGGRRARRRGARASATLPMSVAERGVLGARLAGHVRGDVVVAGPRRPR
jgi:hypothetical protein